MFHQTTMKLEKLHPLKTHRKQPNRKDSTGDIYGSGEEGMLKRRELKRRYRRISISDPDNLNESLEVPGGFPVIHEQVLRDQLLARMDERNRDDIESSPSHPGGFLSSSKWADGSCSRCSQRG